MPASGRGVADIFFGGSPTDKGGINISGVTGVDSTTHAEAWFQHGDTSAHGDNGPDEHEEAAALCPLYVQCSLNTINISAEPIAALFSGFLQVHYNWSTP